MVTERSIRTYLDEWRVHSSCLFTLVLWMIFLKMLYMLVAELHGNVTKITSQYRSGYRLRRFGVNCCSKHYALVKTSYIEHVAYVSDFVWKIEFIHFHSRDFHALSYYIFLYSCNAFKYYVTVTNWYGARLRISSSEWMSRIWREFKSYDNFSYESQAANACWKF